MRRNLKFDSAKEFLLLLAISTFAIYHSAKAESIHGVFFNNQTYKGEYTISESRNADGMRVNPVTVTLKINGENNLPPYTYIADDLPAIKASSMGFLSIIANSGGMEGSITYNYIVPNHGALVSIGIIQTTLHLGKIENIDIQPNKNLTKTEINEFIKKISRFNPPALSDPLNTYPVAALLLLGQGNYLTPADKFRLSIIYHNKEISSEPVLLNATRKAIN